VLTVKPLPPSATGGELPPVECAVCGIVDRIVATVGTDLTDVGVVCARCVRAAPDVVASNMRAHAARLKLRAEALELLSILAAAPEPLPEHIVVH
jgi:hypothetical protein